MHTQTLLRPSAPSPFDPHATIDWAPGAADDSFAAFRDRLRSDEDYLGRFPDLTRDRAAVVELIAAEYALRRQWHGPAAPDEYLSRFPEYGEELQARLAAEPPASGPPRALVVPVGNRPDPPGYQLGAELGRGGMGVVYRAHQTALDRPVAIKTLFPGYARHEAEAIARWTTRVPVSAGSAVLQHEALRLAGRVRGPSPDPRAAALLVETVARAVHHAHQRGGLHRDLKPSNILLDDAGQPHVADFGLAKRFDPLLGASLESRVVGTPSYLAPEQAREPQPAQVDLPAPRPPAGQGRPVEPGPQVPQPQGDADEQESQGRVSGGRADPGLVHLPVAGFDAEPPAVGGLDPPGGGLDPAAGVEEAAVAPAVLPPPAADAQATVTCRWPFGFQESVVHPVGCRSRMARSPRRVPSVGALPWTAWGMMNGSGRPGGTGRRRQC